MPVGQGTLAGSQDSQCVVAGGHRRAATSPHHYFAAPKTPNSEETGEDFQHEVKFGLAKLTHGGQGEDRAF